MDHANGRACNAILANIGDLRYQWRNTHLDPDRPVLVWCAPMVAFIHPHEEPPLCQAHQVLARTLLRPVSRRARSTRSIAGWKVLLFVGWLAIVALWGIGYVIGSLRY